MERIASLIKQLADLQLQGAAPDLLLSITNELQVLLQQLVITNTLPETGRRITMIMPGEMITVAAEAKPVSLQTSASQEELEAEEKIFEMLQVDEGEIEAELEEIRKKAEFTQRIQAKQALLKPGILFDFGDDDDTQTMPTLVHHQKAESAPQPPISEKPVQPEREELSVNDKLKEDKKDVVQFLEAAPIKDLRKGIGINDRYQFINDLFRGDEDMYDRSIKTINNFSAFGEANYWIERELKVKIGWDMSSQVTKNFYALVKRRFS
jgi:hypothetical protein